MSEVLTKKVQNFVFHKKLFKKGDGILIGISGGPDSVALTRVLIEHRSKYDLKLALLHVNYGLRAEDSSADQKLVENLSKELGLPIKVVQYDNKSSGNIEQKMRDFRYQVFEKERKEQGFDWIAVGHTLDDQVETVLMNMIRGTGSRGIGGIREKRGKIIRPLLATRKREIVEFLEQVNQDYRIDKSNTDESFLRNRIRHKLIPYLEREYNPKIISTIAGMADNLRRTQEVVDEYTERTYNEIAVQEENLITLDTKDLKNISHELCSFVFRRAVKKLQGDEKNLDSIHFFEFQKILESTKGKNQQFEIPGLLISRKGDIIEMSKK